MNEETKSILDNLKQWEQDHEGFKRILLVTHGGFINEFYNVMKRMKGEKTNNILHAHNWAVYIFGMDKKNDEDIDETLDSLSEESGTDMGSISDILKYENDHLLINHQFEDEFGILDETR